MLTRRANCAILRRVFLLSGVILGITFAFWQRARLYRVNVGDFAARQQREYAWTGRRQMSLEQYINYKTDERLVCKNSQAWVDLYREVADREDYSFFLTRQAPLNELAGDLKNQYSFIYVALEYEGRTVYLCVDVSVPGDYPASPSRLRFPMRRFALFVLLAGILGYVSTPWPRRNPKTVAYSRFVGALLPDVGVGVLLMGTFFTLPWLVIPTEAGTSHPLVLDGGWIVLTLIMWSFCLFGLAIHMIAAWYEVRSIHIADGHLIVESLLGIEEIPFTDIERVELGNREPPKHLVKAGFLIGLLNWRALGPTLLVAGRNDPVLCLITRDSRQRTFSLKGMYHLEHLIAALKGAGIPVDPQLESPEE